MSDVNQAFLRAYVKSRVASNSRETASIVPAQNAPVPVAPPASRPPVPAQPSAPTQRRVDPPESKLGVWSAIGVERGMKGSVSNAPAPAVVRNAVQAVPVESTLPRTQRATTATHQDSLPNATPPSPSLESLANAWSKKRAPALKDLKPKAPGVAAPASHQPLPAPLQPQGPAVHLRIDRPNTQVESRAFVAEPIQPPASRPTLPPSHHRADPPASRMVTGPHAPPIESRPIESRPIESGPIESRPSSHKTIDRVRLQELPLPVAFAPSWEVDNFFWPEVLVRLEQADPAAFRQIGHHIANANQSGLKVLALTSGERGVGRSTVAMHMARAAASAGLKVALVDADTFNPSLVDQLRLDMQHGWQDCLFEAVPLEEVAVHSISDGITLFPLTGVVSQQQVHANLHRMSKLIRRISTAFDIVLLDSCRLNLDQRDLIGVSNEPVIDAAVLVVDTELSIKEKIDSAISILQSMGLTSVGLIENFRS